MRTTRCMGRGCTVLTILSIIIFCIGGGAADTGTLTDASEYANAGVARANIGDYQGAIAYYNKALEVYPDIAEIHYNRAVALEHMGMQQEAISEYKTAIELDPNLLQAQTNLFILTMDIINPVTIVILILGGCILVFILHRHRKKDEKEKRVMQGIIQE